jgi:glycosyltransferase involved in cell wall biosynthesis
MKASKNSNYNPHYISNSTRVVVSAYWRWHAYQLIAELVKWSESTFYTADYKSPYVAALPYVQRPSYPFRLGAKVCGRMPLLRVNDFFREQFDQWVASMFADKYAQQPIQIFHGWSSFSLETISKIRDLGDTKVVIERSGTHIDSQIRIIEEESERWGIQEPLRMKISDQRRDRMLEEYERADCLLTCSSVAKKSFVDFGIPEGKVASVLLGSNFNHEKVSRVAAGKFTVISVGISSVRKGHHYLLEAWKRTKLPNAELILVTNPGKFFKGYESLSNVRYMSRMSWQKLSQLYRDADVFCLASVEDGFGMVVSEAMSMELPVIVSDAVGASDLVRDNLDGKIFPSRDIEALQFCLESMYTNREQTVAMGKSAGEHVKQYSWERYGAGIKELYQNLLAKSQ